MLKVVNFIFYFFLFVETSPLLCCYAAMLMRDTPSQTILRQVDKKAAAATLLWPRKGDF